VNRKNWTFTLG